MIIRELRDVESIGFHRSSCESSNLIFFFFRILD